jgi:hypothetical protein
VNVYGTKKEIERRYIKDDSRTELRVVKKIVRAEPSKQTIYRALLRLGKTRNRPVGGKSAREKASNLVARIQQTAPLLWIGKAAILKTVDFKGLKATSQGRRVTAFAFLDDIKTARHRPYQRHWEWVGEQAELERDRREHPDYYAKLAMGEDVRVGEPEYGPVFKKR